ncbi:MAG: hypothetical protein IMHGJWDQ_000017 [Candidatus Fervidibacter sp.]
MLARDTDLKVAQRLIVAWRQMKPEVKLKKVQEMNRFLVSLIEADVRQRYPRADEQEIHLRVASRWLPVELMRKAFGWNPPERGY